MRLPATQTHALNPVYYYIKLYTVYIYFLFPATTKHEYYSTTHRANYQCIFKLLLTSST